MSAKDEFKEAQQEYKKVSSTLRKLQEGSKQRHEELMTQMLAFTGPKIASPGAEGLRASQEELRKAAHESDKAARKMWQVANQHFRKSAKEAHSKGEEALDTLANLDPKDLQDFSPEEAAEHEKKLKDSSKPTKTE